MKCLSIYYNHSEEACYQMWMPPCYYRSIYRWLRYPIHRSADTVTYTVVYIFRARLFPRTVGIIFLQIFLSTNLSTWESVLYPFPNLMFMNFFFGFILSFRLVQFFLNEFCSFFFVYVCCIVRSGRWKLSCHGVESCDKGCSRIFWRSFSSSSFTFVIGKKTRCA